MSAKPSDLSYDTGPLAGQAIPGMVQRGNIDVNHRPLIRNADGSHSSIFSSTVPIGKDGSPRQWGAKDITGYALVPSIANGKFLTPNGKMPDERNKSAMSKLESAAADYYGKTRQHLGIFKSDKDADTYANKTHAWVNDGSNKAMYAPSYDADENGEPITKPQQPDINQIGQSALAGAPSPIRRLVAGLKPNFSLQTEPTQAIGPQASDDGSIAGVPQGSPNQIWVTDPQRFMQSPGQVAAHEAGHLIQNNLSPQQQAQIPPENPRVNAAQIIQNPAYLAAQRAAGKTILTLPREQAAHLTGFYTAQKERFKNGAITPQQMQQVEKTYGPWIQDWNKAQMSNILPTDPDSNTLNTTPRAPMPPVNLQQDTVQFDTGQQQGPVTQSVLSGMNQPAQPAPQYVPPVVANTNKWGRLVQGALAGAGGGLSAGLQNVMDAGTPHGPHANGYQAGADASQQLQNQQAQQQQQATAQAQQDFENKQKTFQMSQEAQLNRARTMEATLHLYKMGQDIDNAPKEQQDEYYKGQDAHESELRKEGMSSLGEVGDLNSAMQWMQQNKKNTADVVFTHHKGSDGQDRIAIWENPSHSVDASSINARLHNKADYVNPGVAMNAGDAYSFVNGRNSKYSDQQAAQALQTQKDAASMQRTQATQAGENSRAAQAKASGLQSPDDVAHLGEAIAKGNLTEDQVPGFAKIKPQIQAYLANSHPDLDQNSVMLTGEERKRKDLANNALHNLDTIQQTIQKRPDLVGMISGRISHGLTLAGTDDPDLATINTALDNYALAGTGAHGIRAVQAREDARNALLNGLKNGPQALNASIETSRSSLKNLASAGSPRRKDGSDYSKPEDKVAPIVQRSKSTGKTRISLDGGKTWKMD